MTQPGWLLLHLVATAVLTGVGWVVQVVVYPAFARVPDAGWADHHRHHQRSITRVVALPWVAQGGSTVAMVGGGISAPEAWLGLLALAGVLLTTGLAVPAHARLATRRDPADLRRLLRANLTRTLVWTTGSAVAVAAVLG